MRQAQSTQMKEAHPSLQQLQQHFMYHGLSFQSTPALRLKFTSSELRASLLTELAL
ncbi:hypothetical protein FRB93_009571 [Tulasnella sp. JGI-2019a]|nr:hypothetical protein FRB93_009571 [Tulasnella sp. JGI-2019a]